MPKRTIVVDDRDPETPIAPVEEQPPQESMQEANLRLLLHETLDITIMEEVNLRAEIDEESGIEVELSDWIPRTAHIKVWVPMAVFHQMLAGRKKITRLRSMVAGTAEDMEAEESEALIDWVFEQVFNVWRLTERKMTPERLRKGLNFEQALELFDRFFGALLKRMAERNKRQQGK